jgi:hypothetical protein
MSSFVNLDVIFTSNDVWTEHPAYARIEVEPRMPLGIISLQIIRLLKSKDLDDLSGSRILKGYGMLLQINT